MRVAPVASVFMALVACGSEDDSFVGRSGGGDAGPGDGASLFVADAGASSNDSSAPATDVEALITTDNAYSFGYGDANAIATFIQGGPASNGPQIFDCPVGFGPEPYTVPAKDSPPSAFLYIVAWADTEVTQGTLAQFKRIGGGAPVYSGSGSWQVCATGKFYPTTGPGPDQAATNDFIAQCNQGTSGATYSKGWVGTGGALTAGAIGKLAFGEANDDPAGAFPIVCQSDDAGVHGMDKDARWMWFDPLDGQSPFVGNANNRTQSFLIFRLPASALTVK